MQETLKSICIPLVLRAGDVLIKEWDGVCVDHFKESEDVCTNLDLKIESMLLETLMKHFPDHNFDSEEFGKSPKRDSDYTWIIDPIDGSKNYIRHLPFFNISIALQYKTETIFSIVYAPKTEELFFALRGEGAFLLDQEHGENFSIEKTVRLHGTGTKDLSKAQLHVELPVSCKHQNIVAPLCGALYFAPQSLRERCVDQKSYTKKMGILAKLMKSSYRVRSLGSGAIALCYAARGAYDGYIDLSGTSKLYDLTAGILICEEAGLKVMDITGKKFTDPKKQQLLIAPNTLAKKIITSITHGAKLAVCGKKAEPTI